MYKIKLKKHEVKISAICFIILGNFQFIFLIKKREISLNQNQYQIIIVICFIYKNIYKKFYVL